MMSPGTPVRPSEGPASHPAETENREETPDRGSTSLEAAAPSTSQERPASGSDADPDGTAGQGGSGLLQTLVRSLRGGRGTKTEDDASAPDRPTDDRERTGGATDPTATAATVSAALASRQPHPNAEPASNRRPRALASTSASDGESRRIAFRLDTPARFDTGGRSYDTLDWSIGGFALSARKASFARNEEVRGTFTVFLDQFVVSTTVTAEVVHTDSRRLGFRFEDLSQSQIRMLRSLSAALLSGSAPTGFPVGAAKAPRGRGRGGSGDGRDQSKPLVTLASGSFNALLALVVVGIGLAVFFSPIEPTFHSMSGAVAGERIVVAAEATVTLDTIDVPAGEPVGVGDTLAFLTPLGGEREPLLSPCRCVVVGYFAGTGQTIRTGEPVAQLVEAGTVPVVQALFARDEASAWTPGRRVTIRLSYSGQRAEGRIMRVSETLPEAFVGLPVGLAASPNTMVAWIEPASPLPPSAVGEPVRVEFQQSTGL